MGRAPAFQSVTQEDPSRVMHAVRLWAGERHMSQLEIAKEMGVTQSTISRWLQIAEKEGWYRILIVPPSQQRAQESLNTFLKQKGQAHVTPIVVPASIDSPKNIENISGRAAEEILKVLKSIEKKHITIAVACGETVIYAMNSLVSILKSNREEHRKIIDEKEISIYPTTVWASFELKAPFPGLTVTTTFQGLRDLMPNRIRAYTPFLPETFYKMAPEVRKQYCIDNRIVGSEQSYINKALSADIIIAGVGIAKNPDYINFHKILEEAPGSQDAGIKPLEQYGLELEEMPEICDVPIGRDGQPLSPEYRDLVPSLTVPDLREVALLRNRYVFMLAGGREKRKAIGTLLKANELLPFNTIITDEGIVDELRYGT